MVVVVVVAAGVEVVVRAVAVVAGWRVWEELAHSRGGGCAAGEVGGDGDFHVRNACGGGGTGVAIFEINGRTKLWYE